MVKHPSGKTAGDMAYGTIFSGGNMIYRLADRRRTGVARSAVIPDTAMVEHCSQKTAGHVTNAAILSGREVIGVLAQGGNAIVA